MANKLFLDTSALYAYFDKSDSEHRNVSEFLDSYKGTLFTSNYILDELITLLRYRNFEVDQIKSFIDELWKEVFSTLLYVSIEIERDAWNMLIKYKDHKLSFTDCTSFILMRKNSIKQACSVDGDFKIAGFIMKP